MHQEREPSASESFFWPSVWAVGLHVLIFGLLFASFAMTPDLPEAKPIVQATLYQLKSKSRATTQTNQKIAGEAQKSAARQTEAEQMEQKKIEQQKQEAAEQKKEEAAQKAEDQKAQESKKADEVKKAEDAKKTAEAKKAEEKQLADIAKKKAEDDAKKTSDDEAKKAAAEEAKKQAADDAKKAADDAKKKATEDAKKKATDDAKKKATADAAKKSQDAARKSAEDKKAAALADLLSDKTERQQALADEQGDQTAGNFDDLIRARAAEVWARPPSARRNMIVVLQIAMLPDGTVTSVVVSKSSGDAPFDSSAVAAVKNIGRLTEMQGLKPNDFKPYRSFKMTFTPEDLAL